MRAPRATCATGVAEALRALGTGFLSHPANEALRQALQNAAQDDGASLARQAFFEELLRLVYRLIFLATVEDRTDPATGLPLIFTPVPPKASSSATCAATRSPGCASARRVAAATTPTATSGRPCPSPSTVWPQGQPRPGPARAGRPVRCRPMPQPRLRPDRKPPAARRRLPARLLPRAHGPHPRQLPRHGPRRAGQRLRKPAGIGA